MNLRNCSRVCFFRNFTCPVIEAPWTWKTRFAKSTPIIVSFISPSSLLGGLQHHHLGTLRCRLGRAATIPSMTNDTDIIALRQPESVDDPLTEIARDGARRMLAAALRAEADAFVAQIAEEPLPDGRQRVVRHGYGPERSIQPLSARS